MKLNDNTILRIKVPAHLYESVKAQLTLKEGIKDNGMPGSKTVKVKDSSSGDKPKKTSAPKANAPVRADGDHARKADKETGKMGSNVSEKKLPKDGYKKMGLEELQTLAELLNNEIAKLQEKSEDKKEKAPIEEETEAVEKSEKEGE